MSTISGLGGDVTLPTGYNAKINTFSCVFNNGAVETTGFDSGGFAEYDFEGIIDVNGSATGTVEFDAANTTPFPDALADGSALVAGDLEGVKGTLTLQFKGGCTLAFTALVTSINFTRPVRGKADIVFNFQSTGVITKTWDETA